MSKQSEGKPRWSLLEFGILSEMAEVLTKNAESHGGDRGWRTTENAEEEYFDALCRHLAAYKEGDKIDDDGHAHIVKVMINAMILYDLSSMGADPSDYLGTGR